MPHHRAQQPHPAGVEHVAPRSPVRQQSWPAVTGSPLTGVVRVAGDDTPPYAVTDDGQAWNLAARGPEKITAAGISGGCGCGCRRGQVSGSVPPAMFMQGDKHLGQLGISIVSGVTTALSQVQNISNRTRVAASRLITRWRVPPLANRSHGDTTRLRAGQRRPAQSRSPGTPSIWQLAVGVARS